MTVNLGEFSAILISLPFHLQCQHMHLHFLMQRNEFGRMRVETKEVVGGGKSGRGMAVAM